MQEYKAPETFRSPSFTISIGPCDKDGKRKQIKIEDLAYGKHREFIHKITSIWMQSRALPATGEMFNAILQNSIRAGNSPTTAIEAIQTEVLKMYDKATGDDKIDLLKLLTDNQITDKDIKTMTGSEINGILIFLINSNMESEKNFEASLSSMMNRKNPSEK